MFIMLTRVPQAQAGAHEIWEAIESMVKNISEAMLTPLPNFWRISKSFMEGRYKKVTICAPQRTPTSSLTQVVASQNAGSSSRRSPTQCRTMALDIIKLYISLLSEFFIKEWAEHFRGKTEEEIDAIARSFHFDNCLHRDLLNKVLTANAQQ